MVNELITTIEKELSKRYPYKLFCISEEMDSYIKDNFEKVPTDTKGRFYKVYKKGTDAKYCHYMVDPYSKRWRHSTSYEFYN